jgi:hypothetical protein
MRSARLPLLFAVATFSAASFSCGASHRPALAGATEPPAETDLLTPDPHPLDVTRTTLVSEDIAALLSRCIADSDCSSAERCEAGRCAIAEDGCEALPIAYFGFDESSASARAGDRR